MKKRTSLLFLGFALLMACNDADNDKNDTVDKADSINESRQDIIKNDTTIAVDEKSSEFIVRAANASMAELEMVRNAGQVSTIQHIKNFAAMLGKDHESLQQQIKSLAATKNIALPAAVDADDQKDINDLAKKTGKNYDKEFINEMIDRHKNGIKLFEDAAKDANDADIKAFANNSLTKLRMHLDSAQAIKKMHF
jgi:putative membrane protein